MRPKSLPSSLRKRKRYIVYKIISEESVDYSSVIKAVWGLLSDFLGGIGLSQTDMWVIKNLYNSEEQRGVVKCNHDKVEEIRTGLTLIKSINEVNVIIVILGVTGTINSAKKKYLGVKDLKSF